MAHSRIQPEEVESTDLELLAEQFAVSSTEDPAGERPRLVGPTGVTVELPHELYDLLAEVVRQLRDGNGITVISHAAELTTVQAADMLNMSRPHLIKLIEAGDIPFHKIGTHRRLRLTDVLAYQEQTSAHRHAAMTELVDEFESHDLAHSKK